MTKTIVRNVVLLAALVPACAMDAATSTGVSDEAVAAGATESPPESMTDNTTTLPAERTSISIGSRSLPGDPGCAACTGGGIQGCVFVSHTGFTGCRKSDSSPLSFDWTGNGGWEDFVIAPNRTIWHSWGNSNGWKVMPNDGRADDMSAVGFDGSGRHFVDVQVNNPSSIWRSVISANAWTPWVRLN